MKVINLRKEKQYLEAGIAFLTEHWGNQPIYLDCLTRTVNTDHVLPHWFFLIEDGRIIGSAGLVTNDFISSMEYWPWLCALTIDEEYRGMNLGSQLISAVVAQARESGFDELYLCTDHIGYYETFGFVYDSVGYHPWGESSRIYRKKLTVH